MEKQTSSAKVKLKLLMAGIMIEKTALEGLGETYKEYQYGYNDSNWAKKNKQELIPSELLLPGNFVVAPHIRPTSPFIITKRNDALVIINKNTGEELSKVGYLPRPKIWDLHLSNGESIKKYLNIYGMDCLNLFILADCEFWNVGRPCVFCSLKPTQVFHNEVVKFKAIDKIDEALQLAFSSGDIIKWMIITGGSRLNRQEEIDRYCNVLNCIGKHIPISWNHKIQGNAALLPSMDISDLIKLHKTGICHPSFNLEVWDKELFDQYCPGKAKYIGFDNLLSIYKNAVEIWGRGEVWCNFVGGISPIQKLKDGFRYMADMGVVPGANIFHVDPSAPAAKLGLTQPTEDYVLEMYHELGKIYREYGYRPYFSHSVLRNSLANEVFNGWL